LSDVKVAVDSPSNKFTKVSAIGILGSLMTGSLKDINFATNIYDNLLLAIPFLSVLIIEVFIWFWLCIKPSSAATYSYRRSLNKKKNKIKKEMRDKHISDGHRQNLQKLYDKTSQEYLNSFNEN